MPNDSVGCRTLAVADAALSLTFSLTVLYPTDAPSRPEPVGPYQLDVALDAPVRAGRFPVVLVSHGTGGSGLVYRTWARELARRGYVVGLPEHPHNNRDDDRWAGTPQNLVARPRHLQLALDRLVADADLTPSLKPEAAALVGHSLGGYTALALAGGQPAALPPQPAAGPPQRIPVPPADPRVKALVLLAPAAPWFGAEGALRGVQAPVLLVVGEKDEHTPPAHAETVRRGLPDPAQVQFRVVENAGHFAFLSPFPAARVSSSFPPSQDPPGFDRVRFQQELVEEISAFLARHL